MQCVNLWCVGPKLDNYRFVNVYLCLIFQVEVIVLYILLNGHIFNNSLYF